MDACETEWGSVQCDLSYRNFFSLSLSFHCNFSVSVQLSLTDSKFFR